MLTSLGIIFIFGLIFAGVFKKLGLPSLVGMLITGIILGPSAFDLIDESFLEISDGLRKIALVVILLRAGLALDFTTLKQIGNNAFKLSIIPAMFEMVIVSACAYYFLDFNIYNSILLGTVVSAVSPAVVVPYMLNMIEKSKKRSVIAKTIMMSASLEDVLVIVLFFSSLTLATTSQISPTAFLSLFISIILGIGVGFICGYILSSVFKRFLIVDSAKAITLLAISLLFLSLEDSLTNVVQFSGLIAIMVLGITLNSFNKSTSNIIGAKFKEIWVAAEIVLFVLVGAKLDVNYALNGIGVAILIITLGLLFRFVGVYLSLLTSKYSIKEKLFVMISFIPKATVQAAIGPIALSYGLASGNKILSIAVIAILITAPLGSVLMLKMENVLLGGKDEKISE